GHVPDRQRLEPVDADDALGVGSGRRRLEPLEQTAAPLDLEPEAAGPARAIAAQIGQELDESVRLRLARQGLDAAGDDAAGRKRARQLAQGQRREALAMGSEALARRVAAEELEARRDRL